MKTSSNTLFMLMTIISTISVMNSSSWLSMWICLEINMMSFIPLIYNYKNIYMTQSMMTYFLTQSMSSMMFISLILINNYTTKTPNLISNSIILIMMIKMGMPPMHLWFIQMMTKMSWLMCLIMLTWQKIGPTYIMSTVIELNKMTMTVMCLSTLTGAIMGLNQTSIQKIMGYSSINHMGWMMACTTCNKKSWMMYLILYSLIMSITCMFMYTHNIMFINQMNMPPLSIMEKMTFISLMLSLGGIPPFLGFLPKWLAIQYMISSKEILIMIMMTLSSLITLAYYLRMISSMNLLMNHSQKWMMMSPTKPMTSSTMIIINNMLPMMILSLNYF